MDNTKEPKKAVSYSLANRGTPAIPRWIITDQWGRAWDDNNGVFVTDVTKGTLYCDYAQAAWSLHEMLLKEYQDKPIHEFEVPIKLRIYADKPLTKEMVAAWCYKACRMQLDANGCGLGPMDDTLAVIAADWSSIKEV